MSVLLVNQSTLVSANAELIAWDTQTWKVKYYLRGHEQFVRHLEPINSGNVLLSAGDDSTIKMWDLTDQDEEESEKESKTRLIKSWSCESHRVYSVLQDPEGSNMVALCDNDNLKFWRLPTRSREIIRMMSLLKQCGSFCDLSFN
jgi:hypothetical protein